MRKILFLIFLLFGIASCSNQELVQFKTSGLQQSLQNHRTYSEMMEIAKNSIVILQGDEVQTRSTKPCRTLNLSTGVKAYCLPATRAAKKGNDGDTLICVFNFCNNQGFAVVSASRQTEGLIAVTEYGSYDPTTPTGNPAFDTYMDMAKSYVAYQDEYGTDFLFKQTRANSELPRMYREQIDTTFFKKIEPRLNTRWGQTDAIGQFCPNGISGCSNTALAQIMCYYKYPKFLTLSYENRDLNSTRLDWENISDVTYTRGYYPIDETAKQIGRLGRQLGQSSGSNYKTDGTFTAVVKSRNCIQQLCYNVGDIKDYKQWLTEQCYNPDVGYPIANSLSRGKLIWMCGVNSDGEGHAWVVDGCYYIKAIKKLMCSYDGSNWFVERVLDTYRTTHNHINWGWDGIQNGYFYSHVFNVYNSLKADPGCERKNSSNQNANFYDSVKYFEVWR